MTPDNPKLRYGLELLPAEHEGKPLFMLRDGLGYRNDALIVSPALVRLLEAMNGDNSIRDIQAAHLRRTGELLHMEELLKIVQVLDEHLFLENRRFREFLSQELLRFDNDPIRPMQHAGQSYSQDPIRLTEELEQLFSSETGGPGAPRKGSNPRKLFGLVAPHIDIRAGGACFAHAYKSCCEAVSPEVWVVLGTGHEPIPNYFALLPKDFETPLGLVRYDQECCQHLIRRAPRDLLAGRYNHRREHSIEFQAVFLAFVQPAARIVPLLCSFSEEDWERDRISIDETAAALQDLAGATGKSVGFLASVDLAHIGPRYGDRYQPTQETVEQHLAADMDLLEILRTCDSLAFISKIAREQNRRRICGLAPLYMLAKILEGRVQGEILKHSFALADNRSSFVTFASMAFYGLEDTHNRKGKGVAALSAADSDGRS